MDFATLPPEVNSGLMYAGPGSGPMLAAAQAWESIAAELYNAAGSYESVVSGLIAGPWLGPSSIMMAAAANSYVSWLSTTAAQAEQTATQAIAAAAAYESAFAATVPPPAVAANRSQLAMLVATNLLGQNTPAIAATEAQYGEMWAQDAVAMYGYAGSSAAATQMTPFTQPQQNTDSGAQASAVSQAAELPAGSVQSGVSSATGSAAPAPGAAGAAASALGVNSPLDLINVGADAIAYGVDAPLAPLGAVSMPIDLVGAETGLHTDDIVSDWDANGAPLSVVRSVTPPVPATTPDVVSRTVSAGVGESDSIGRLSVPPTWVAATPAVRPIALALPAAPAGAAATAMAPGFESTFGEMALAGTAGRAIRDAVGRRYSDRGIAEPVGRLPINDRASAAEEEQPTESEPRTVVTGIAAEIREFARLRDEGLISDEEYVEQRNRLLGR
ncbi:PPE family protein, SVP subgroup [Mycobacterium paraffinicum]|uniref:PPE family protein n=1 Tax=Mycobacterium paraffinicum TaxID=53378 RepID=A0ABP8F209_9MYCO|nr:PPE domain-containing protein [Mycobacterium paraffinicum]MCV7311923.1 PPE domain-containing protein [Mycobacterium paraffinicum]